MSDFVAWCERAARAGGEQLLAWRGKFAAREKAPADLVTEADLASQQAIRDLVLGQFPDHDFLGEEGQPVAQGKSGYRWVVDPLDGTTNYVHGLRAYCVSVALQYESEIVAGCVWDPENDECFTAGRGTGAFLNGQPIRPSNVTQLRQALVACSFQTDISQDSTELIQFTRIVTAAQSIRRLGSAALNLCYVACGRLDAYWSLTTNLWDVAAGMLLVEEAGGLFTNLAGQPFDEREPHFLAAGQGELHRAMRERLLASDCE